MSWTFQGIAYQTKRDYYAAIAHEWLSFSRSSSAARKEAPRMGGSMTRGPGVRAPLRATRGRAGVPPAGRFSDLLRVGLTPPAVRLALLLGVLVGHRLRLPELI
jgi:hypothetical protein